MDGVECYLTRLWAAPQGLDFIPALQLVQAMRGDASLLFGGDENDEDGDIGGEEDDDGGLMDDEDGGFDNDDDDIEDEDNDDGDEDDEDGSGMDSEASSLPGLEEIAPPINRDEYDQLLSDDDADST